MRIDGRKMDELRPLTITRPFLKHPEGSALIELGDTTIICTASLENRVPHFLNGSGQGWVTAEYAMLPRSTGERMSRERGGANSRSLEIQRLIGRSLRAVVDLEKLAGWTVRIDCDVIQADGGTRTAAISGAYVALADALYFMIGEGILEQIPICDYLSAVSVGIITQGTALDLSYLEDSEAEVDMNVVITAAGKLVEIQGSAEKSPFSRRQLALLLDLAAGGAEKITGVQKKALGPDIRALIEGNLGYTG